ncbi:telomere repeat-binding factor 5-like [Salvia splendens]|uniref:telomere repeat-binding factor 5-like n=1 Tax=Salvia splendens TaxID=180675 RepID=UPI001C265360|nr:telomere repeat-binding factor 5-like [Salvia splendens]
MGNPKQKWTAEEEEALRAGVAKHGAGKWKIIHRDPEFHHLLSSRSNIDLKDKWRNLFPSGQGPRDKSKATKAKRNPADAPATPLPTSQTSGSVTLSSQDVVMIDSLRPFPEGINAAKYNTVKFEALSTLIDLNGLDSSAIASFIEQKHEVPIQPRPNQSIGRLVDTVEEAAASAAYQIAEAENKSFVAADSVKEAERVARMAQDEETLLQFAMDCFNQTTGEILVMA